MAGEGLRGRLRRTKLLLVGPWDRMRLNMSVFTYIVKDNLLPQTAFSEK